MFLAGAIIGAPQGRLCPGHWGCSAPGIAPREAARVLGLFLPRWSAVGEGRRREHRTEEEHRWTRAGGLPCLGFTRPCEYAPELASGAAVRPPGEGLSEGDDSGGDGGLAHGE